MAEHFPSVTQIVPNIVEGDEQSWNQLVSLFYEGLCGRASQLLAGSSVKRRIDPEDLANMTIEKAWNSRERIRAKSTKQMAAFLLTVLRNTFLDECKGRIEDSLPSLTVIGGNVKTPSSIAMTDEDEYRLHACLAELTENQRKVFERRYMRGMKFREIADDLGITEGAVAGLIRNAVKKISGKFRFPG